MAAYLTLAEFKALSLIPATHVDELEVQEPGWVLAQLDSKSRWIDARLRKRYAAPFVVAPVPQQVLEWLTRIVTWRCYLKKGVDPTDAQVADIVEDGKAAEREVAEAASSVVALFDLPLRQDQPGTGIVKGGPLSSSEASPYTWTTRQRERAIDEI